MDPGLSETTEPGQWPSLGCWSPILFRGLPASTCRVDGIFEDERAGALRGAHAAGGGRVVLHGDLFTVIPKPYSNYS